MPADDKSFPDTLDIVSFVALFLAIVIFCYMAFYRTANLNREYFRSLTKKADAELVLLSEARKKKIDEVKAKQQELSRQGSAAKQGPVSDVPMFLKKINNETIASGLELANVEKLDNYTYKLTAYAPFYRLLNFLFRIEKSNLGIQNISINPFSTRKSRILLTLKVLGEDMSENNRLALEDFQKNDTKPLRNFFQRGAGVEESIDLTWKFKLSGTGFHKKKYATIDHKNYYQGNVFNGMRIVRIKKDRVELESGSQKYFIGFRIKRPPARL